MPGYSWLDDLAQKGYDTWALDFRGFGQSSRPASMEQAPLDNPPAVRATEALRDVEAAVRFITTTRHVRKVNIVGWSWGAVVASMYAIEYPDRVNKLVLYGAMHGFSLPSMTAPLEESRGELRAKLTAYQLATFDMTLHHWFQMMKGRRLATNDALEAVGRVFVGSDPTSGSRQPVSIRRPMGPLLDLYHIWSNRPLFDAAAIGAPVLVIRGDSDFFADPSFFEKLTGTKEKREVVIKDATHWVIYERHRDRLLSETARFLGGGR